MSAIPIQLFGLTPQGPSEGLEAAGADGIARSPVVRGASSEVDADASTESFATVLATQLEASTADQAEDAAPLLQQLLPGEIMALVDPPDADQSFQIPELSDPAVGADSGGPIVEGLTRAAAETDAALMTLFDTGTEEDVLEAPSETASPEQTAPSAQPPFLLSAFAASGSRGGESEQGALLAHVRGELPAGRVDPGSIDQPSRPVGHNLAVETSDTSGEAQRQQNQLGSDDPAGLVTAGAAEVSETNPGPRGTVVRGQGLTETVTERVVVWARMATRGSTTEFEIRIEPPELGTVTVQLTSTEEAVSIRLVAANEIARQIIQAQLEDLRRALDGAGIDFGQCDVTCDSGTSDGQQPSTSELHDVLVDVSVPAGSADVGQWAAGEIMQIITSDRVDVFV